MATASLFLILSINVVGLMAMTAPACTWTTPKYNVGVDGFDVGMVIYANQRSCQLACEENAACLSIQYHPGSKNCFLNKVKFSDDKLTEMKNFVYLEKNCSPCEPPRPQRPCTWAPAVKGRAIANNNVMELEETTLESCQQVCEQLYYCKSIDWKPLVSQCSLNAEDDTDGQLGTFKSFDWYKKDCSEAECN
ncbi:hypothetical protein CAPTEDRAFT_226005 [Capitella teleta]|uniref:Apple domain-containing protein n=1 Tax=Capitella teleta TaxID=283909 RepID=R7VFH4_CAPTE|nr:hypothetical protein CAPTEDRAFT_226005 [Capitella teleta]|eukprot:ELU17593.1 hypothetical protein CAPTEDRAFT_226005 [Capitella teleta]